ncbi:hypothetical protein, partial [Enterobacter intestinihominis]
MVLLATLDLSRVSGMLRRVWVFFFFVGFKISRSKKKYANVVGFFFVAPLAGGQGAGGRAPDR